MMLQVKWFEIYFVKKSADKTMAPVAARRRERCQAAARQAARSARPSARPPAHPPKKTNEVCRLNERRVASTT